MCTRRSITWLSTQWRGLTAASRSRVKSRGKIKRNCNFADSICSEKNLAFAITSILTVPSLPQHAFYSSPSSRCGCHWCLWDDLCWDCTSGEDCCRQHRSTICSYDFGLWSWRSLRTSLPRHSLHPLRIGSYCYCMGSSAGGCAGGYQALASATDLKFLKQRKERVGLLDQWDPLNLRSPIPYKI